MYQNILVNALVNLGDVVRSASAAEICHKVYPAAKINYLSKTADNPPSVEE